MIWRIRRDGRKFRHAFFLFVQNRSCVGEVNIVFCKKLFCHIAKKEVEKPCPKSFPQ